MSYTSAIDILTALKGSNLVSKESLNRAIDCLSYNPIDRIDKLARKISHLRDTIDLYKNADDKLDWCVKTLEEEILIIRRITNTKEDLEDE